MKTEFTDGFVGIRPYRKQDIPLLFEAVRESIDDLVRWMPWCHPNYSLSDSTQFVLGCPTEWEKGEHYSFMIYETRTNQFVGGAGLNFVNRIHNFCNVGYWVRTSRTGQGIASAGVRLIARFGLEELRFNRLEIVADVDNLASQRVAEKAGAKRDGLLRKGIQLHGKARDAIMFSMIAEDLPPC